MLGLHFFPISVHLQETDRYSVSSDSAPEDTSEPTKTTFLGTYTSQLTVSQLESDPAALLALWRVKPNHLYFESTIEDVNERHSWQGCEDISWISHHTQIEFSLSWESMQLEHLAYEKYDLYDPLNHIWEETKNQRESPPSRLNIKETHTLLVKYRWGG